MSPKNKLLTSLLAGAAFLASQASAAIVVTESTGFPLEANRAVDVIDPSETNNSGDVTLTGNRQLTQTFQVDSAFTLTGLFIEVGSGTLSTNTSFDISIFEVADTNAGAPNSIPSGSNLLTTTSVSTPSSFSGSVLQFDFTGADQISLSASTGTEGYAVQFNRSDTTDVFVWKTHQSGDGTSGGTVGPDLYAPGQGYGSVLGGGFTHGNTDYSLAVVPEPSSFALLAGMFGLTWIMLRRRAL